MSRPGYLRAASSTNLSGNTAARSLEGKLGIITGGSRGRVFSSSLHVLINQFSQIGSHVQLPMFLHLPEGACYLSIQDMSIMQLASDFVI